VIRTGGGRNVRVHTVPSSPRWTTVVFDLDGTLVDTIGLIVASYQHAFRTVLGREEDETRIRSWIGQPLIRGFRSLAPERAEELFSTYLDWNHANTERLIRRYAGIDTLLADLAAAGVGVAVATSKLRTSAQTALKLTGLDAYLDVLVTLEDTDAHKPDPAPLLLAVERLGGRLADAVYVGDAVVDVQAGRRAGMAAVGVTWGAASREAVAAAEPDVVADTVAQLRAALLPEPPGHPA
jgi:pyrophosphatase PpaX